jgi:crotonobetainyl-CoA:carnitine CoA-transferase CaiB-like acyl-CoA transferase
MGTGFATVTPYRVYEGSDGKGFAIAVGSEKLWSAFCGAIERPEFAARPDFATNAARCANRGLLDAALSQVFATAAATWWVERLRGAGIPCTPVRDFEEVVRGSSMFPEVDGHRVTGIPGGRAGSGAPEPGEHTESVLAELLGLDQAALEDYERRGAIAAGLK